MRTVDESEPNIFASPPSREADAAWLALLRCTFWILDSEVPAKTVANSYVDDNLVVQEDDLIKIDKSSVPLRDGSGYLSGLGVMHQLHCLVSLEQNPSTHMVKSSH